MSGIFQSPFWWQAFDLRHQPSYFFPESFRTIEPVSSSDFRLEMIFGQPPDTAPISFEGSRSIVCTMESFTADPLGSSSSVQSEWPSALSSGLFSCCHRMTSRRGGSASTISPASVMLPSRDTIFQEDPGVHLLSQCVPNQYCFMNSASVVSADHSLSGVVRIYVT